jgi:hypothetical protein
MGSVRNFANSAFAACLMLSGCAEHNLAPVSGVVTLDGKPLVGGEVRFQPMGQDVGNPGPDSTGITDDVGRFELETQDGDAGAVVGTHRVRISSRVPNDAAAEGADARPSVELVPAHYNLQTTLTFPVPAEGTSKADFILETD